MKRIILGLSILLMLVQNGFAKNYTNTEYDKKIAEQKTEIWKQIWRCNKAIAKQNKYSSDVNICLKSIRMQKDAGEVEKNLHIDYLNAGVLYRYSAKDKIKAFQYYMKSAKLGDTTAQSNLDRLCKESPWACK